jgi:hypothetical protein
LYYAKIDLANLEQDKRDIESKIAFTSLKIAQYEKELKTIKTYKDFKESERQTNELCSQLDALFDPSKAKMSEDDVYKAEVEAYKSEVESYKAESEAAEAERTESDAAEIEAELASEHEAVSHIEPISRAPSFGPPMPFGSSPLNPMHAPPSPAPQLRQVSRVFSPCGSYASPPKIKRAFVPASEFVTMKAPKKSRK